MKVFPDDFMRFEGGPLNGENIPVRSLMVDPEWPPPTAVMMVVDVVAFIYRRMSYSEITDEQREAMTHVCRGALYQMWITAEGEAEALKELEETEGRAVCRMNSAQWN